MTVKFVEAESDNSCRELVAVHVYSPESFISRALSSRMDPFVFKGKPSLVH